MRPRKKQDDRYLKRLNGFERRRQERIRRAIEQQIIITA